MLKRALLWVMVVLFGGFHQNIQATTDSIATSNDTEQPSAFVANNRDYVSTVRALLQNAKSSVSIMLYQARFYPEHPDSATNYFLHDIIDARTRGVEVNIVADTGDWNPQGGQKNTYLLEFLDMLTTSGVRVWEDSPSLVSHEKVIVVDSNLTLVSSHNWNYYSTDLNNEVAILINDKSFNAKMQKYFVDRISEGKPRANVSPMLNIESMLATTSTLSLEDMHLSAINLDASPVSFDNRHFYSGVLECITNATKQVTVVQRSLNLYDRRPSFASKEQTASHPGEPASTTNILVDALAAAKHRGLQVDVVLDKSSDAEAATNDSTASVLEGYGITVYADDESTQTHAKMLLVDDDTVILGSTNWTWPAFETGNEVSVLLKSKQLNKAYHDFVSNDVTSGVRYLQKDKSVWTEPAKFSAK